jgi:hypothetical protein
MPCFVRRTDVASTERIVQMRPSSSQYFHLSRSRYTQGLSRGRVSSIEKGSLVEA